MERKLKFSDFAELIGCTPKTVYKMKDRNEIKTVIEKVNGREIQLVVTSDTEIEKFALMNGKGNSINGNYEDILTYNEDNLTNNNPTQINNNNFSISEMFDKIIEMNEKYNNEIKTLNEELLNSKSQVLYLEDKASREGLYLKEIDDLKHENSEIKAEINSARKEINNSKKESERLIISKQKVINLLLGIIAVLCIILTVIITVNVVNKPILENEGIKKESVEQAVIQPTPQTQISVVKKK